MTEMEAWRDKYLAKLLFHVKTARLGDSCLIWNGCKTGNTKCPYGRINIRMPDTSKFTPVLVHRLSFMLHNNVTSIPTSLECSHLCSNSLCIRPEHLHLESRHINASRKQCHAQWQCQGHGSNPPCVFVKYMYCRNQHLEMLDKVMDPTRPVCL